MTVKATLKGAFTVVVTGLDTQGVSKSEWRAALDKMGLDLQERISESFANEKVAGSSWLKANSAQWNRRKFFEGLDPRRGHATGRLAAALDGPRLFTISAVKNGRATIRFLEPRLHGRVPYATYYEDDKVRRAGILALAKSWVQEDLAVVKELEAQGKMRAGRVEARRRASRVARRLRA